MCAISEVILYAPCELLRGRIQWIDAAGCGDSDKFKTLKCSFPSPDSSFTMIPRRWLLVHSAAHFRDPLFLSLFSSIPDPNPLYPVREAVEEADVIVHLLKHDLRSMYAFPPPLPH